VHPAPEVLLLMAALLHGDWDTAEDTTHAVRRDASGLVAAHLQWHLERQLRSLPFVERRAREAPLTAALGSDTRARQAPGDDAEHTNDTGPGSRDTPADTVAETVARETGPGEAEVAGAAEGARHGGDQGDAGAGAGSPGGAAAPGSAPTSAPPRG